MGGGALAGSDVSQRQKVKWEILSEVARRKKREYALNAIEYGVEAGEFFTKQRGKCLWMGGRSCGVVANCIRVLQVRRHTWAGRYAIQNLVNALQIGRRDRNHTGRSEG